MSALTRFGSTGIPSVFDDFIKPWNEWFTPDHSFFGRTLTIPSVNITDDEQGYTVALAAPGLNREDFKIDLSHNVLTISTEKEEDKEEKDRKFTRREYNYTAFKRSFTMPEDVNIDKIEAKYTDGVLSLSLPRKEALKQNDIKKQITVQ